MSRFSFPGIASERASGNARTLARRSIKRRDVRPRSETIISRDRNLEFATKFEWRAAIDSPPLKLYSSVLAMLAEGCEESRARGPARDDTAVTQGVTRTLSAHSRRGCPAARARVYA